MKEDIKALITLENKDKIYSGYRPTHLIGTYFTTGIHRYIEADYIDRGESKE